MNPAFDALRRANDVSRASFVSSSHAAIASDVSVLMDG
jgi:hypothetical protein